MSRGSSFAWVCCVLVTFVTWCGGQTPPPGFRFRFAPGATNLPTPTLDPSLRESIVESDIDGDGRTDFVVVERSVGRLSYYLARGRGEFVGPRSAGSATGLLACALVDLDRDGFPDLLGVTSTRAFRARNLSGQGFAAPMDFAGWGWDEVSGLLGAADVDRDGDVDVIVGTQLHRQDSATRTFVLDPTAPLRGVQGRAALADLDADGDPDLVSAAAVYWNDGSGRFASSGTPHLQLARAFSSGLPPVIAPFRGAPASDLLFLDTAGDVRIFLSAAQGTWIERTALSAWPPSGFSEVGARDFDRDGRIDVLLVRNRGYLREPPSLTLMRNLGNGVFHDGGASALPHTDFSGGWAVVGDWSGDGAPEVLLLGIYGYARLYWNDGRGRLLLPQGPMLPIGLRQALRSAAGDLDGDGAEEIVLAYGGLHLLRNDGWGRFSDASASLFLPPSESCVSVLCVDLDGDGLRDVIAACPGQSRFYRNQGNFQFRDETSTRFPALPGATREILAFDADGDGDPDLLQLNGLTNPYNGRTDRLLLNDGRGFFAPAPVSSFPTIPEASRAGKAGDFDRDGDLDLFLVGNDRERLLLNDGRGAFRVAPAGALPPLVHLAADIDVGDLDGDGDLDLYLLKSSWYTSDPFAPEAGGSEVYRNDGQGRFARVAGAVQFDRASLEPYTAQLYDIDADGDLDVVEARGTESRLLRNDGSGHFTRVLRPSAGLSQDLVPALAYRASDLRVGDWDRDQDADLLVLFWNGSGAPAMPVVLQGTLRHLVIPVPPSVGGDLELVIMHQAPITPPATWIAFLSAERMFGGISIPPIGTFGLGPAGLNAFAPAVLASETQKEVIPLPPDASLMQQMVHVQALFLPSPSFATWRLSGVVSTVVLP